MSLTKKAIQLPISIIVFLIILIIVFVLLFLWKEGMILKSEGLLNVYTHNISKNLSGGAVYAE